jgi:hypothetical protein
MSIPLPIPLCPPLTFAPSSQHMVLYAVIFKQKTTVIIACYGVQNITLVISVQNDWLPVIFIVLTKTSCLRTTTLEKIGMVCLENRFQRKNPWIIAKTMCLWILTHGTRWRTCVLYEAGPFNSAYMLLVYTVFTYIVFAYTYIPYVQMPI